MGSKHLRLLEKTHMHRKQHRGPARECVGEPGFLKHVGVFKAMLPISRDTPSLSLSYAAACVACAADVPASADGASNGCLNGFSSASVFFSAEVKVFRML